MKNPIFVDDKNIQLVTHHDGDDSDNYNIPSTSRVDKITFEMPGTADEKAASNLRLRQKKKMR